MKKINFIFNNTYYNYKSYINHLMLLILNKFHLYLNLNQLKYINYHLIYLLFISYFKYLLNKKNYKFINIIHIIILSFFIYLKNYLFIFTYYFNQFFFKYQIITFHSIYNIFNY